jgi:hypothetical protein
LFILQFSEEDDIERVVIDEDISNQNNNNNSELLSCKAITAGINVHKYKNY